VPFTCLKSIGKSVTKLDGSLNISSSLVVLSKLMLLLVLSLMSNCSSKGSVLAMVLMDVDVVAAVVDKIATGVVVAVIAAILVPLESLDSEVIACVDDLAVPFVVVVSTVVDLVVRLVLAIIAVGFVVRLVVDLSVVDVD